MRLNCVLSHPDFQLNPKKKSYIDVAYLILAKHDWQAGALNYVGPVVLNKYDRSRVNNFRLSLLKQPNAFKISSRITK